MIGAVDPVLEREDALADLRDLARRLERAAHALLAVELADEDLVARLDARPDLIAQRRRQHRRRAADLLDRGGPVQHLGLELLLVRERVHAGAARRVGVVGQRVPARRDDRELPLGRQREQPEVGVAVVVLHEHERRAAPAHADRRLLAVGLDDPPDHARLLELALLRALLHRPGEPVPLVAIDHLPDREDELLGERVGLVLVVDAEVVRAHRVLPAVDHALVVGPDRERARAPVDPLAVVGAQRLVEVRPLEDLAQEIDLLLQPRLDGARLAQARVRGREPEPRAGPAREARLQARGGDLAGPVRAVVDDPAVELPAVLDVREQPLPAARLDPLADLAPVVELLRAVGLERLERAVAPLAQLAGLLRRVRP